jgi:hypothetical protein
MKFPSALLAALFAALMTGQSYARQGNDGLSWTTYRNERYGFNLQYPADVFAVEKRSEAGDGAVFASADGQAKLLAGALANEPRQSVTTYQDYVQRNSYAGFAIDYRPLGTNWFVLSGDGNGQTVYEKVMFSCEGRLINSFALIYPTAAKRRFDAIVEGIQATFRPGRICDGLPGRPASRREAQFPRGPRSAFADRIARQRGQDVIVVLRRTTPPYDRRVVRGYVSR